MNYKVFLAALLIAAVSRAETLEPIPPGWRLLNNTSTEQCDLGVDGAMAQAGQANLSIVCAQAPGVVGLSQTFEASAYYGKRVRFSAWLRSGGIEDAESELPSPNAIRDQMLEQLRQSMSTSDDPRLQEVQEREYQRLEESQVIVVDGRIVSGGPVILLNGEEIDNGQLIPEDAALPSEMGVIHIPDTTIPGRGGLVIVVPNGQGGLTSGISRTSISGWTDWEYREIIVDIPSGGSWIVIGFGMSGKGQLWIRDLEFEEVPSTVPVTFSQELVDAEAEQRRLENRMRMQQDRQLRGLPLLREPFPASGNFPVDSTN